MYPLKLLVIAAALSLAAGTEAGTFDWLVGCWASADMRAQEVWIAESDGSLAGFSVTIDDNAARFYEVLRLQQGTDGTWTFTAYPSGQSPTSFVAQDIAEHSVVFVNAAHDYPQEIRYARQGDELLATISLVGGEDARTFGKSLCSAAK